MVRSVRLLLLPWFGFAVVSLLGYWLAIEVTHRWFDHDLRLRADVAVRAAARNLEDHWHTDSDALAAALSDITGAGHIIALAACSARGELIASTALFPHELPCVPPTIATTNSHATWSATPDVSGTPVHLSAAPLRGRDAPLGVVLVVQDLSEQHRRDTTARNLALIAFLLLSVGTTLIMFAATRISWRQWTRELRKALTGTATREFQPLLRDVRSLVDQLTRERTGDSHIGAWNPTRLRATLTRYLRGERIVILANREPYIHEHTGDGVTAVHPASGLVTALEPVMRACSGVWVAHGAGSADRETVDAHDRVAVPPGEESYVVRRVWLSEEEENGYYYGFSNEGLWPLCHVAHMRPIFRADDWEHYVRVNRRFANAVCDEVDSDDPIVLVQDYHFALAPQMIRERLPRATILTFWHIPWPSAERFGICPWSGQLLRGLLGSSIVGFHTQQHCNNFLESIDAQLESRVDRETQAVVLDQHKTLVRAYPISIEWPVRWMGEIASVAECRDSVRAELHLAKDALLGIGVDRLDYTKGVEERFQAVDELLTHHPEFRGRFTFVQIAAPSRTKIDHYRELNQRVEKLTATINQKWGHGGYQPIILLRSHHQPRDVFRYYRAAEVCYVSSLHDGMNLVAKEFIAARDDAQGVLVLSKFTGAARELTESLIVNPYDLRQVSAVLATALHMPRTEQRERMLSLRRVVSEFNVYRWAGRMLVDAAETRRRQQLSGKYPLPSELQQVVRV